MNADVYSPPMDFRLSDEQLEFQRHCHAFARDVMRPAAAGHDRDQSVPYDVIRAARAWGLHGMPYLERVGRDESGVMNAIYAEELHWGCAGIALAISGSSLAAAGIAASGTPEQAGRWRASARATRSASAPTR
jgi:alkylation response protein AidB-like acyl-CoA dehydrogenase